jgi:hypothetical protein
MRGQISAKNLAVVVYKAAPSLWLQQTPIYLRDKQQQFLDES